MAKNLARRLRVRDLYKCLDIGASGKSASPDARTLFKNELKRRRLLEPGVLQDEATISAYTFKDFGDVGDSEKILIRNHNNSGRFDDAADLSEIVKAFKPVKFYRVYAENDDVMKELNQIRNQVKH